MLEFKNDQERQVWGMVYATMLPYFMKKFSNDGREPGDSNDSADMAALSWADGAVDEMREREPYKQVP